MASEIQEGPELVVGLVGPIGCDMQKVSDALTRAFKQVDYTPHHINVTRSIELLYEAKTGDECSLSSLEDKINKGNSVRKLYNKNGVLAAHAIVQIREARKKQLMHQGKLPIQPKEPQASAELSPIADEIDDTNLEAQRTFYIIKQLKRPEEIELLTKTYGRRFIQVSVTLDKQSRISLLSKRIGREEPSLKQSESEDKARRLVERDEMEDDDFGQRITEIFHLGDVFVRSNDDESIKNTCTRFIDALFGKNNISPTRDEFGSYIAKSASLRSVDLSRQVGAAIFMPSGDLITVGCNEVPKPGGGNYWDEDSKKARDIDLGGEANKDERNRIVVDFLNTLKRIGIIETSKSASEIMSDPSHKEAIMESLIGDITEYGRMVHAEMTAISDAARLGRSTEGSTMYVTTYPCHNCAKHIISSGIKRVVFIEPYQKSRTELLFEKAVSVGETKDGLVSFEHFSGISPRRFRDIFEKGKRRGKDGEILDWYDDKRIPRIGIYTSDYHLNEHHAIVDNIPEEM